LISSAEAADSMQLAALPSVTGAPGTLPSFGSTRPEGASATYHTVADGETIWDIAKRHGVTVEDIKSANGIGEAQVIQAGQVLKVPSTPDSNTAENLRSPAVILSIPQEVAANPSTQSFSESSYPSAAELLLEEETSAPEASLPPEALRLSEFLDQQRQTVSRQPEMAPAASEPRKPLAEASERPMATLTPRTEEVLAALPEAQPVEEFAEQVELPAKARAKFEPAEVESDNVLQIFRDDQITHRVGSGETIWSIARSYGISPDTLQTANGLDNPNFIVAGNELIIPADSTAEVNPDPDVERLAYRQVIPEQHMASVMPVIEKANATPSFSATGGVDADTSEAVPTTLVAEVQPQSFALQDAEAAIADPFVEGLLAQVASINQAQVDVAAATAERAPSEAAGGAIAANTSTEAGQRLSASLQESTEVAINPQFVDQAEDELTEVDAPAFGAEEFLAAAPLGSEVYAPVIESPEGRVVSPEMPVLPGSEEYLPEAPNRFEGYIWPAQGVLTSGYGWRWGRMHRGVDIAGPVGTPIYAAGPGVVVKSGWNSGGYGNLVDIRHPDGSLTRYAHNSRLMVSEGQEVRQGQQIAEMGSTGYSTGPHLHFEIHVPNQGTVNPIALLPGR
jgi:murein DD-endopeptidase MepM/ murein hydrolase activator NlpD